VLFGTFSARLNWGIESSITKESFDKQKIMRIEEEILERF